MIISAYLIHVPTGDLVKHSNVTLTDYATLRSVIYRTKRALGVSHLRHTSRETGDELLITLHGSNVIISAERIETL
jgi:hypothetical protein